MHNLLTHTHLLEFHFIWLRSVSPCQFSCVYHIIHSLLLAVTLVADDCIKKHCDKTWVIPSNEDLTIKLSPCDQCTTCDSPFETQTVHAWWSYQLPNGSWTEEIDATVIDHRDYEIKVR